MSGEYLKLHPRYDQAIKAAQLTDKQAAVLDLYLRHHSIRTIARAQGVHEATVRGHLDSALRRIRPFLEGKDEAA